MTLNKFIKRLLELQKQNLGRSQVLVDKDTLTDGNGCWNCCDIKSADGEQVFLSDGDGGTALRKDGQERYRWAVLLKGGK